MIGALSVLVRHSLDRVRHRGRGGIRLRIVDLWFLSGSDLVEPMATCWFGQELAMAGGTLEQPPSDSPCERGGLECMYATDEVGGDGGRYLLGNGELTYASG